MKRTLIMILALTFLLSACARPLPQEQLPASNPQIIVSTDPEETPAPPSAVVPVQPEEPAQSLPYLEKITKTTLEIMEGPGYQHPFVMVIDPGTYTIVEETTDESGLLWGRLKSGAGWIDLTYSREITNVFGPITVSDTAADFEGTHTFVQEGFTDWGSHYLITTTETVTDLQLRSCDFLDKGPTPAKVIYQLDQLQPGEGLRATLLFYGDLTNYALTYTDGQGQTHTCTMMLSGRDGSLVVQEYAPELQAS